MNKFKIDSILSGGQTGADRAALDAAIQANIPHGGWCPKGRLSEAGAIPSIYQLKETSTTDYAQRTKWNIRDSDGTLILIPTFPLKVTDGTILTLKEVKEQNKPHLIVDISIQHEINEIINWIRDNNINILNIAGPRESQSPGIYLDSHQFLCRLFEQCKLQRRAKL